MTSTYESTIRNLLDGRIPELISFFQAKGVLKSSMTCNYCNVEMIWTKKSNTLDKFVWKCQNKRCEMYKTTKSVRSNSFLETSQINLQCWLEVLYRWGIDESITQIQKSISVSSPTLIKIF